MCPARKAILQNDLCFSPDDDAPSPFQFAVGGGSFQISSQVFEHFLSFPWGDNRKNNAWRFERLNERSCSATLTTGCRSTLVWGRFVGSIPHPERGHVPLANHEPPCAGFHAETSSLSAPARVRRRPPQGR